MILLDTNLLIYAHRSAVPEHRAAKKAIAAACADPRGCGIAAASLAEFHAIVTHPKTSGRPSKATEAASFIELLRRDGGLDVWLPGRGFADRLLVLAAELGVVGARIFDLQIAVTGMENGATEIWSRDHGFVRIPGLPVIDPLRS